MDTVSQLMNFDIIWIVVYVHLSVRMIDIEFRPKRGNVIFKKQTTCKIIILEKNMMSERSLM